MIFTALLSVIFLRRIIKKSMWLGMMIVLLGLITVGVSDVIFGNNNTSDQNGIIAGRFGLGCVIIHLDYELH